MEDNFVSYEIAKQLKELGFDEECFAFFNGKFIDFKIDNFDGTEHYQINTKKNIGLCVNAPLLQQVKKWFLTKHGVHTTIDWEFYDGFHYFFKYTFPNGNYGNSEEYYDTMDEAEIRLIEKIVFLLIGNKPKKYTLVFEPKK